MKKPPKIIPWYEVYHELALALQKFYNKSSIDPGKALFDLLDKSPTYKKYNKRFSLAGGVTVPSVEPIQLFVSFNRAGQNERVRLEIIAELARLLKAKLRAFEGINFEGCPTPVALAIQSTRQEPIQNRIWYWFNELMEKGEEGLTSSLWREMKDWKGVGIAAFTIFSFWIDSNRFLPLDRNTRRYLESGGLLSSDSVLTVETYKMLLGNPQIGGRYVPLSIEARYFNQNVKLFKRKFKEPILTPGNTNTAFRLVGLRTLNRNGATHKILPRMTYYPLDHTIVPAEMLESGGGYEEFHYQPTETETLYDLDNLKISVTAIVGKNGSGKSTLLDLVLMGIYNLSKEVGYLENEEYRQLKALNFEIYWHTDTLYKLVFSSDVKAYRFEQSKNDDGAVYRRSQTDVPARRIMNRFFYSLSINYSHYALNGKEQRIDWITPLSHKNDGYNVPVAINPMRIEGNIEINREKELLNMRLLLNVLELHDADLPERSFRYLDSEKCLNGFSVEFDKQKAKIKTDEAMKRLNNEGDRDLILEEIYRVFVPEGNVSRGPYRQEVEYYLIYKLFSIIEHYQPYKREYRNKMARQLSPGHERRGELRVLLNKLLNEIKDDPSHVPLKFKQAVNYLKHGRLQKKLNDSIKREAIIDLDDYDEICHRVMSEDESLIKAELLPPALFKLDFFLNDRERSSFVKASSGEYQLLGVLSSILYHIRNIDSVGSGRDYNYVTVLLDEIELYFHPNMQRSFVRKLLEALSKLDNNLYGVHLLFSTHSPFILSDIHHQRILKLDQGKVVPTLDKNKTFAANIHDLLADEFFLNDGSMGAFAQKKIEIAINLFNYFKSKHEIADLNRRKELYKGERKNRQRALMGEMKIHAGKLKSLGYELDEKKDIQVDPQEWLELIEIIGEPLIQEKLRSLYLAAFPPKISLDERERARRSILRIMEENNISSEDL